MCKAVTSRDRSRVSSMPRCPTHGEVPLEEGGADPPSVTPPRKNASVAWEPSYRKRDVWRFFRAASASCGAPSASATRTAASEGVQLGGVLGPGPGPASRRRGRAQAASLRRRRLARPACLRGQIRVVSLRRRGPARPQPRSVPSGRSAAFRVASRKRVCKPLGFHRRLPLFFDGIRFFGNCLVLGAIAWIVVLGLLFGGFPQVSMIKVPSAC